MAVNKVEFGGNTLIDLTGDTLESAEQLMKGIVAHCKDGSVVEGTLEADSGGTLTVTAPAGVYVILSEDGSTVKEYKIANSNGIAIFKGLKSGVWYVGIYDGEKIASKPVTITTDYSVLISFNAIPEFTYTGDYEIVNDADEPITTSQGNWKIRFLTSGVLTFTALNGAENGIDVFLVGGGGGGGAYGEEYSNSGRIYVGCGGGGGGGGRTSTKKNLSVSSGTEYSIVVGSGGSIGGNGGASSAFNITASGGNAGGNGAMYTVGTGGNGGSNGGNGGKNAAAAASGASNGSPGQGSTTREFTDSTGTLYSGGGGGGGGRGGTNYGAAGSGGSVGGGAGGCGNPIANAKSGSTNTGGGGGGGGGNGAKAGSGGSGIVIIRNHREAVTA